MNVITSDCFVGAVSKLRAWRVRLDGADLEPEQTTSSLSPLSSVLEVCEERTRTRPVTEPARREEEAEVEGGGVVVAEEIVVEEEEEEEDLNR
jgi:hypothetical protein